MVISCCPSFSISVTDIIEFIGIIVNLILAIWIVNSIQKTQADKRVLKDHFISEIKEIRKQYAEHFNKFCSGQTKPRHLMSWYKLMNIKVDCVMNHVSRKYKKIPKDFLKSYQVDLWKMISESPDFVVNYKTDELIEVRSETKADLQVFQQTYHHLFNDLIIKINDA